jgi:hypothetical protein
MNSGELNITLYQSLCEEIKVGRKTSTRNSPEILFVDEKYGQLSEGS